VAPFTTSTETNPVSPRIFSSVICIRLQAATGWAAECLGQEADLGTVEPGKLADLVVVAGDPLAEISVLQDADQIRLVLKGGRIAADRLGPRNPI